jgi:cysteine synthase A
MVVVMPENMSKERVKLLKLYGAKVILTSAEKGPIGAIEKRDKLSISIANSWVPGQFNNYDNIKSHEKGIALELLNQVNGNVDYLVHGVGTGGTLMGVAKVLKKEMPNIKIIAVEPNESAVLSGEKAGNHNIQGIGEGFIPSLIDKSLIDKVIRVKTSEAIRETKKLMKGYGLFVGISSGANISAIKKLARKSNKPKTILTIFADSGGRYLSIL